MRTVQVLAAVVFAAAFIAPSTAATTSPSSTPSAAQSRTAQCEAERKACLASKTQTGSYGARYVAPEDVKMCSDAYRMCTGQH